MVLFLLLAAAAGVALLYIYFTWNYDFWKKRRVPYVKPTPPFGTIGDFVLQKKGEGFVYQDNYKQFPDCKYVGAFQFRKPILIVRDLDLVRAITVKDFDSFHDHGMPMVEEGNPLSLHLFNLEGKRWRALRSKLTPVFTSGKMRLMYQMMDECADAMLRFLEKPVGRGEQFELREVFARFTTDVIGSCAMGLQMNAQENEDSEFRRVGRNVFAPTTAHLLRRLTMFFLPSVARAFGFTFEGPEATEFFPRAVREMVEYREKNDVKRNDFIDLLIQIKKHGKVAEDKEKDHDRLTANAIKSNDEINMTDGLLAAQVFVFFLAGFETSSTASSFILYELALNPDLQNRLRDEVDEVLSDNGGRIPYEALMSMQYLDKVWNEGLRKYPPANNLQRVVTRPYKLPDSDVTLPVGMRVIMPSYAIHHDPQHYPDPERFDPERFNEENKAKRHHYAFLPFGEGPRICIGMRFGIQQGKLGLAKLISQYRFSPCERTQIPLRFDSRSLVTASTDGIWLKVEPR